MFLEKKFKYLVFNIINYVYTSNYYTVPHKFAQSSNKSRF